MKKRTKIALILALLLVVAGIGTIVVGLATIHFDLSRLNISHYVTTEEEISDPFTEISIDCRSSNVRLHPAEDGRCRVVFTDTEQAILSASVQDGVLQITQKDNRNWYDIKLFLGFLSKSAEINVYLPTSEYSSLRIKTISGDIDLSAGLRFHKAELKSSSGDVACLSDVEETLSVKAASGNLQISSAAADLISLETTSGDIQLDGAQDKICLEVKTESGDILLKNLEKSEAVNIKATSGDLAVFAVTCRSFSAETTSGNIELTDLIVKNELHLTATSGDIRFTGCDADSIWIATTSGDVNGSVLSEKLFRAESDSGSIIVPHGNSGGFCNISTTSGDIHVDITSVQE